MRSLRSRLSALWLLSLVAVVALGFLLVGLYRQSTEALADRGATLASESCRAIADRYGYYAAGWAGPAPAADSAQNAALRADLTAVARFALADRPGLAGGFWRQGGGLIATTAPLTATLTAAIASQAQASLTDSAGQSGLVTQGPSSIVLRTCALSGPVAGLVAWTAVTLLQAPGQDRLRLGLGVLLALAVLMSGLLAWTVMAWSRRITLIEAALTQHEAGALPHLPRTGERELDRIVAALNAAGERLAEARRRGEALAAQVALSERLAALGRVAAGVAHEIRNPIAAMRLTAENALAAEPARRGAALEVMLRQVARLDRLSGELLAMTQRRTPRPATTDVTALLAEAAAAHGTAAVAVQVEAAGGGRIAGMADPALLGGVLDNLLGNAVRHTPAGGQVRLRAEADAHRLVIEVADGGPGVDPALRGSLFEPFVTGRADGTGLGLAIARELAAAHGGTLVLADPGGAPAGQGAVFRLEVPWLAS
ncbi:MAG: HAMP domain-containing histidine kinase [Rhodospirillales bacterium]|nr:HAMP domain-containing histidine kinase [Rhodospirillales bacterium]